MAHLGLVASWDVCKSTFNRMPSFKFIQVLGQVQVHIYWVGCKSTYKLILKHVGVEWEY